MSSKASGKWGVSRLSDGRVRIEMFTATGELIVGANFDQEAAEEFLDALTVVVRAEEGR